jgi:hypothetical protein
VARSVLAAAPVHDDDALHAGAGEVVRDAPANDPTADDEDVPAHRVWTASRFGWGSRVRSKPPPGRACNDGHLQPGCIPPGRCRAPGPSSSRWVGSEALVRADWSKVLPAGAVAVRALTLVLGSRSWTASRRARWRSRIAAEQPGAERLDPLVAVVLDVRTAPASRAGDGQCQRHCPPLHASCRPRRRRPACSGGERGGQPRRGGLASLAGEPTTREPSRHQRRRALSPRVVVHSRTRWGAGRAESAEYALGPIPGQGGRVTCDRPSRRCHRTHVLLGRQLATARWQ